MLSYPSCIPVFYNNITNTKLITDLFTIYDTQVPNISNNNMIDNAYYTYTYYLLFRRNICDMHADNYIQLGT